MSADQSTKFFNTAIIATKVPRSSNYSVRLNQLIEGRAFQAILRSIQEYARASGLPEEQAAEEVIQTFRQIDELWDQYIFQEGLDKLRGHLSN